MAGGKERALRTRIRAINSTKKITKAMELISASRIVRAQQRVAAARPYSEQLTQVIRNLAAGGADTSSPLLVPRVDVRKVGFVVITADRGMAGAYNANLIRLAERSIREHAAQGRGYSLIVTGRKGAGFFRFRNYTIDAAFAGMSDQPTYEDARSVAAAITERFESGDVDQVELIYTQFLSVATQRAVVRRLMPLDAAAITETAAAAADGPQASYEFEPEPTEILGRLLPRYVEARVYAAMLDASASEHAARQRAMKSATDNAEDLITKLSRAMNRARQDSITTEIMEIVGGSEALRQARAGGDDLLPDTLVNLDLFPEHLPDAAATLRSSTTRSAS